MTRPIHAVLLLTTMALLRTAPLDAQGLSMNVVRFDGRTGYIELPGGLVDTLSQATVEAWVKWERFNKWSRVFDFGRQDNSAAVRVEDTSSNLTFVIFDRRKKEHRVRRKSALVTNVWTHVAAVCGSRGMKLYLNGELVGSDAYAAGLDEVRGGRLYIGRSNWPDDELFDGYMAEFRIWNRALGQKEILARKDRVLTGAEAGLVGYWRMSGADGAFLPGRGPAARAASLSGGVRVVEVPAISRFLVPGELEKAAEEAYRQGLVALNDAPRRPDKSGYIEAHRAFRQAQEAVPDYKDTAGRMRQAAEKARFKVGLFLFGTGVAGRPAEAPVAEKGKPWGHWKTRRRESREDLTADPLAIRRIQADFSDLVYRDLRISKPPYARLVGLTALNPVLEDAGVWADTVGSADILNAAKQADVDLVVLGEFSHALLTRRHDSDRRRAYTVRKVPVPLPDGTSSKREEEDRAFVYHVIDQEIRLSLILFYEVVDVATGRVLGRDRLSVEAGDEVHYVNWENVDKIRAGDLRRRKRKGHEALPHKDRKLFGARRKLEPRWELILNATEKMGEDLSMRLGRIVLGYIPAAR